MMSAHCMTAHSSPGWSPTAFALTRMTGFGRAGDECPALAPLLDGRGAAAQLFAQQLHQLFQRQVVGDVLNI